MSVIKRETGWCVRTQINGERYFRALGPAATKHDALEYEANLRHDVLANVLGHAQKHTAEDALLRWLEGEAATLKSYDNLKEKARLVRPYCKGKALTDIARLRQKPQLVDRAVAQRHNLIN